MMQHAKNSTFAILCTCLFLVEFAILDEVEPQISAADQIHNQVQVFPVLEGKESVDEELILEALEQLQLVHDTFHAFLEEYSK